mmetsp:Transcript_16412/g.29119  ORF Transcript_16412/g.29119 Transcript_16412/m.29119 type:complete len:85 (+) Transcript_16412:3140-3394(+)
MESALNPDGEPSEHEERVTHKGPHQNLSHRAHMEGGGAHQSLLKDQMLTNDRCRPIQDIGKMPTNLKQEVDLLEGTSCELSVSG